MSLFFHHFFFGSLRLSLPILSYTSTTTEDSVVTNEKKLKEDYHWRHRHRLDNHSLADISRAMLNRSGKVDRRIGRAAGSMAGRAGQSRPHTRDSSLSLSMFTQEPQRSRLYFRPETRASLT